MIIPVLKRGSSPSLIFQKFFLWYIAHCGVLLNSWFGAFGSILRNGRTYILYSLTWNREGEYSLYAGRRGIELSWRMECMYGSDYYMMTSDPVISMHIPWLDWHLIVGANWMYSDQVMTYPFRDGLEPMLQCCACSMLGRSSCTTCHQSLICRSWKLVFILSNWVVLTCVVLDRS